MSLNLASGDIVEISVGVFEISKPLIIAKSNVKIIGNGAKTIIRLRSNSNCPVFYVGLDEIFPQNQIEDVVICNLTIDGNRKNQTSEHWRPPTPGGWFTNNGITFRNCSRCLVDDVLITSSASGGIVFALKCTEMVIQNVTSVDNEFDGIAWGGLTSKSSISRCKLNDNIYAGISFDIGVHDNIVDDVTCDRNIKAGLFMRESSNNYFFNSTFTGSEVGVYIADGEAIETLGSKNNRFDNCTFSGNQKFGFWLDGKNSDGNRIINSNSQNNLENYFFERYPKLAPIIFK